MSCTAWSPPESPGPAPGSAAAPAASSPKPGPTHLALVHGEHGRHQLGIIQRRGEGWGLPAQSQDQEIEELGGQHLLEESHKQGGRASPCSSGAEAGKETWGTQEGSPHLPPQHSLHYWQELL